MADAFLHRRSIFDKHKDSYSFKNPIKQMRVSRSWNNPITRHKREKSLHDWASSFAGKRHYRKLSRHNALHLHEEVESLGIPAVYSGSTLTLADGSVVTGISPGIRGKCNVTINAVREGDFTRLVLDWDEQDNPFDREVHSKYELDYTNHGTKYDHSIAYLNDLGALAHHEAFHLCEEHMSYDIKDLRDKLCTYLKNEVEKVDLDYDVKKLEDSPYPSLAITSKPDDGHYYLEGYLVELKPSDVRFKYQYYGHPHEEVVIVGDDAQDLDVIAKYLFAQVEPKVAEEASLSNQEIVDAIKKADAATQSDERPFVIDIDDKGSRVDVWLKSKETGKDIWNPSWGVVTGVKKIATYDTDENGSADVVGDDPYSSAEDITAFFTKAFSSKAGVKGEAYGGARFGKYDIVQALAKALHNDEDDKYGIRYFDSNKVGIEPGYAYASNKEGEDAWKVLDDGTVEFEFAGKPQGKTKIDSLSELESTILKLFGLQLGSNGEVVESAPRNVLADNKFGKIVKARQRDNVLAFLPLDDDGKNDDCTYFFKMDGDNVITKGYHWGRDEIDRSMIAEDGYPWTAEPNRPTRDWVHTKEYAKQLVDRVRKCLAAGKSTESKEEALKKNFRFKEPKSDDDLIAIQDIVYEINRRNESQAVAEKIGSELESLMESASRDPKWNEMSDEECAKAMYKAAQPILSKITSEQLEEIFRNPGHDHEYFCDVIEYDEEAEEPEYRADDLYDFSSIRRESKCEWLDPEGEAILKEQAPKLIDALNAEFERIGSPARLGLADNDVRFSDGYYLPVKSAGKWDDESRMLNLRLAGKTLNGVKYYDGNIYLEKGWRPTSFRGSRRMSLREKLAKMCERMGDVSFADLGADPTDTTAAHGRLENELHSFERTIWDKYDTDADYIKLRLSIYKKGDQSDKPLCTVRYKAGEAKPWQLYKGSRGALVGSSEKAKQLSKELKKIGEAAEKHESAEAGITSRDVQAAARSAWSTSGATDFKLDIVRLGDHIIIYAKGPNGEDSVGISWHVHIPSVLNSYETPHVEQFAVDTKGDWPKEPERTFDAKDLDELENQLVDEFKSLQETLDIAKENS